ncbi:MAG: DPP IV N-terminal domain-containing protein, partial [bacterium]
MNTCKSYLCLFSAMVVCYSCDLKFQETTSIIPDQRAIQVTTGPGAKSDPAWSPDGTMIAFSYQSAATNVIRRTLSGEDLQTLGTVKEDIRNTKFDLSPDGTKFVYRSNASDDLWVLTLESGSEFVLTPQHSDASEPAWSPDGQWVAFTARGVTSDSRNVWVIPATGGASRKLTDTRGRDLLPSWSPDSKKIAFESIREHHNGIWVVDIESGESRQLTSDSTFNRAPDWSPDGSTIAYYSTRNASTQIWTIPTNGGEETQITSSTDATNPSWSPDGSKIAYRTSEGVWTSSVVTKEILNRSNMFENYPIWWPDVESLVGTINAGFSNIRTFSLVDSTVSPGTEQLDGQFDSDPEWY